MESIALFEEKIPITPKDLSRASISIDKLLEKKLADKLEGKCSLHGWVKPAKGGERRILSRSMGYAEKGRFTGDIVYHVQWQATVINPPSGLIVTGEVIRKNKMGMYVNFQDAVRIILPRDLHIGDEDYEAINVGERISVEIKKSRFQVNDEYILSVGLFRGRVGPAVQQEAPVEEPVVEEPVVEEPVVESKEQEQEEEKPTIVLTESVEPLQESKEESKEETPGEIQITETNFKELSLGFPSSFTVDGKKWPTLEHYFQAMKFPTDPAYQEQIRGAKKPTEAKKLGSTKEKVSRADWDTVRDDIMKKGLLAKVEQNEEVKNKLLSTGTSPITYASTDPYWGIGTTKKGKNRMGILLLELRSALRSASAE